ncbi:MAG: phosphoenolpyruvate synthase [Patescibacteria group bacterium]
MLKRNKAFILPFSEISIKDIPLVGGKNASLGEMYRKLTPQGIPVPNGFAITAFAYRYLLTKAGIKKSIQKILKGLNVKNVADLQTRGQAVRQLIMTVHWPKDLEQAIRKEYRNLSKTFGVKATDVAVRSSATAEDLPDASFAGQQETYLHIKGEQEVMIAAKKCISSLFTNRAIFYRQTKGFDHFEIALSVGVQKMVRSDKGSSGVMFTIDTESGFRNVVLINAAYGLGEFVVKGAVNPDEFYVYKPTLKQGFKAIISKQIGSKEIKLIYNNNKNNPTKKVSVLPEDRNKFCITEKEILQLAEWGMKIEEYYKKPMDIEWAKDGISKKLFIVQARPETVESVKSITVLEQYQLKKKGKVLVTGAAVGAKIGSGAVSIIKSVKEINKFKLGSVLVTVMTDPDWVPIMKQASAIVTEEGGRTCHAAIVSRELGIPAIVGTQVATKKLKNNQMVTVSCADGAVGKVYEGKLPFKIKKTNLTKVPNTKTKIMVNIGEPDQAFKYSFLPHSGVGLAREEFIINSLKIHPLALLAYPKLKDKKAKRVIEKMTAGYKNKADYFVEKLASGVAMLGAAFYPEDVIVRLSDFKTNEYANLIGGRQFEPVEDNPMIGWRGASRYYDPKFEPAFRLECQALKKTREVFGLTNIKIMVPFCRTVEEGEKVLAIMAQEGLKRGKNGLEVYVMCEIPANVILAEKFANIFDGFSIGSNDLTQLALGIDRDSGILKIAGVANEKNEAVKSLITEVISKAKKAKRKIGICGQGPSDFPDFAEFLVEQGIDSISLNPDTVVATKIRIAKFEKSLRKK